MKIRTILILGMLIVTCCEQTNKNTLNTDEKSTSVQHTKKLDNKEVPEELLTLNTQPTTDTTQKNIDDNLFGKFFCDRAQFYIIRNPQNNLYSARPESITLYYLDNELRQTKYILTNDIVTRLLHELGNFKIVGLDPKNRALINDKKIIVKTEKGMTVNSKLDNFELRWTFGNKEVKYRVSVGAKDKFVYSEKDKNYETEFRAIEKYCI